MRFKEKVSIWIKLQNNWIIKFTEKIPKYLTLFGKADIDMSVALGSFMTNSVYAEAEPEFQQTGYFTTRISLKNSSQSPTDSESKIVGLWKSLIKICKYF